MSDFLADKWPLILVALLGLLGVALLVWVCVQPNGGCPAHTVSQITGWVPVWTGKSMTMVPITECVKS